MEVTVLVLLVILFFFTTLIFLTVYLLQKRQIKRLSEDLKFFTNEDTNTEIFLDFQNKEITELAICVNDLLVNDRNKNRELIKMQKEFRRTLTSISHDIRTPLTSLSGYLQMIEKGNLPPEKVNAYLEIVNKRIEVLKKLLEQLFEFLRLENDEILLKKENCSLNNILSESIAFLYDNYVEQGISPIIEIPYKQIMLKADSIALSRVFNNILYNSLIHGNGDNKIKLYEEENRVIIIFSNMARGISKNDIDHIFDRFYTTKNDNSRKTTGLGLSIAKLFVEKMNGVISAELKNSVFTIKVCFKK